MIILQISAVCQLLGSSNNMIQFAVSLPIGVYDSVYMERIRVKWWSEEVQKSLSFISDYEDLF